MRLARIGAVAAQWAAALCAAVNFGRLNTPETTAGPIEYALYCGLPALVAVAAGVVRWAVQNGPTPDRVDPVRQSLLAAVVALLRLRRHDSAARIADMLKLLDDGDRTPPAQGGGH